MPGTGAAPHDAGVHEVVAGRLGAVGQRYTAARRTLVALLAGAGKPMALPELLALDAGLAQSSAYRNLTVLEQAGAVQRVAGGDDFARYELAEDLTAHHHHLVCTRCGGVTDVELPGRVERLVQRELDAAAGPAGFQVTAHRLDLVGICRACA